MSDERVLADPPLLRQIPKESPGRARGKLGRERTHQITRIRLLAQPARVITSRENHRHSVTIATARPEDDLEAAARQVIREKHGKHVRFYDPISYRGHVV